MRSLSVVLLSLVMAGSAAAATVPRPAPEFVVQIPKGSQLLLSQYRGKVVCLEFLYTTCVHCQHASQLLSKLQTEYGPKGFQALGVAFNDMASMLVPDFVRDYKVNYPVGFSPREPIVSFLEVSPNAALHVPQLAFIDKKGMIRHQSLPQGDSVTHTEANIRKMIEQLLAEPGPTSGKKPGPAAAKKKSS
jgi:peroxiredoxin